MNQKATRKLPPRLSGCWHWMPSGGAVIGMLIGTGGSKVLLAAALPERKLNLLYRPFAKVGKAALMFTALQLRGVPSRLCLFPGENHELSRSGRPRQRLRRLEEMLRWYQRYLNKQEA